MSLPDGFIPLRDAASAGDRPCFLGVIVQMKSPFRVRDQWVLEFTIQDQCIPGSEARLDCRAQRANPEHLPPAGCVGVGDMAILRYMSVVTRNQKPLAETSLPLGSELQLLPAKHMPTPDFIHPYSRGGLRKLPSFGACYSQLPTPEEQVALIHLKHAMSPFLADITKSSTTPHTPHSLPPRPATEPKRNRKLCEIKDMGFSEFHDLVAEVVKSFSADYTTLDLYVTDYTSNKDLFLYEDPDDADDYSFTPQKKWTGPIGQMTMAIRLWEPHASYARENIREGDFVFIQNIQTKLSQANKLEGALRGDRKFPDKVQIHLCTREAQMATLKQRKEAYGEVQGQRKLGDGVLTNLPKKPSARTAVKRKEEKRARQRLQKELEQQELEKKTKELDVAKAGINPHIRAGHVDRKLCTIAEIVNNPHRTTKTETGIMELPFVNCKYRARVRVVDLWPLSINDFARSVSDPKYGDLSLSVEERARYKNKFEWNFALLVEDADAPVGKIPERLTITIGDKQGQGLLKMDACDLIQKPEKCNQLEEKMFILWGNLRERKIALKREGIRLPLPTGDKQLQLQNTPFDCCIEEYGEPVGDFQGIPKGWMRRFSVFDTTIMD